jgi:hypothetical protein
VKHLLVVNPRWADASAPDTLRVRSMLPFLWRSGWRTTVVSARGRSEPGAEQDARICWVDAWPLGITRRFGIGSDGMRSYRAVHRCVDGLLASERIDVAFFSTTAFELWRLGRAWARQGLPYVLDWQDPWYDPEPPQSVRRAPPGGRLKHALTQLLARRVEPGVVRGASGHVSVSAAYLESLRERYGLPPTVPQAVEPFAADVHALMRARAGTHASRRGSARRWVCVGRAGDAFRPALEAFFAKLAESRESLPAGLRIEFVGTGYGKDAVASVTPLAERYGLGAIVDESPCRVAPEVALARLAEAERVLLFVSDDDRYVPSRLTNAIGIGRPVVVVSARSVPGAWHGLAGDAVGVTFLDGSSLAAGGLAALFDVPEQGFLDRSEFFARHSAEAMTTRLLRVFDAAAARGRTRASP